MAASAVISRRGSTAYRKSAARCRTVTCASLKVVWEGSHDVAAPRASCITGSAASIGAKVYPNGSRQREGLKSILAHPRGKLRCASPPGSGYAAPPMWTLRELGRPTGTPSNGYVTVMRSMPKVHREDREDAVLREESLEAIAATGPPNCAVTTPSDPIALSPIDTPGS